MHGVYITLIPIIIYMSSYKVNWYVNLLAKNINLSNGALNAIFSANDKLVL